jgi:uncharacterized protein YjdB
MPATVAHRRSSRLRSPSLLLLAPALLLGACSDARPVQPERTPGVASVEIAPRDTSLAVGQEALFIARALDKHGEPVSRPAAATWISSAPELVEVSAVGRVRALVTGQALIIARIGDVADTATVTVPAPPAERVEIRLSDGTAAPDSALHFQTGASLPLTALAFDASDHEIQGLKPTFRSSNAQVARVAEDGTVTTHAQGQAIITATAGKRSASLTLKVEWAPPATLALEPDTLRLAVEESARLALRVLDEAGNALPVTDVRLESEDRDVADVDAKTYTVRAHAVGSTRITAALGELSAHLVVQVSKAPDFSLSRTEPAVLRAGEVVKIRGAGFGTSASALQVRLGDGLLKVEQVSDNEITLRLAADARCAPREVRSLSVTQVATARSRSLEVPYSTVPALSLAPGESRFGKAEGELACFEIEQGGEYALSVTNTGAPSGKMPVLLQGSLGGGKGTSADAGRLAPNTVRVPAALQSEGPASGALSARTERAAQQHARHLEQSRKHFEELRRLRRSTLRPAYSRSGKVGAAPLPAVGSTQTLRFPASGGGVVSCDADATVSARVVYVGSRLIILEDPASRLAGQMDSDLVAMGKEFDQEMYPLLVKYFGDPLAMDAELDNNGRLLMLLTPRVNQMSGNIAGFVASTDFYPRSICPGSNMAEIFYAMIPRSGETPAQWRSWMRSTLIHEAKHITSFAERLKRDLPFEETWLEESSASLSEELWYREHLALPPRSNLTFAQTVRCELSSAKECEDHPEAMRDLFTRVARTYQSFETLTPIGNPREDSNVYGSGWLLIRYALDHYAGSEADFVRALLTGSEAGIANLAARARVSKEELLSGWAMATLLDDHPSYSGTEYRFTTWNTRDVFLGLHNHYKNAPFAKPFPLEPHRATFGRIEAASGGISGGSSFLLQLSGAMADGQAQLLKLRAGEDTPLPATARVTIVRVK